MMKKITIFVFLAFAVFTTARAQDNPVTVAVPLLNEAPDARSSGMGNTGAATSPDLVSQHWNLAKYVFIDGEYGVSLSYTPWLRAITDGANQMYLSGYYKFKGNRTLSASLWYNTLGTVYRTDDLGLNLGDFNANQFSFDVAYSQHLAANWSGGVLFRYINSNLMGSSTDTKVGQAIAVDLGVYHQKDVTLFERKSQYAFGLSLSNIGTKVSYSDNGQSSFLPMNMRLGGRIGMDIEKDHNLAFALDLNKLLVPAPGKTSKYADDSSISALFHSFGDAPGGFSEEMKEITYSLGLEYTYRQMASLRMGYYAENQDKGARQYLTFGAGVLYKHVSFDVSYLVSTSSVNDALSNTFRFTLGVQLSKLINKKEEITSTSAE